MKFIKRLKFLKAFSLLEASLVLAFISLLMALGMNSPLILNSLRFQSDISGIFQALTRAQSLALAPRPANENICGFGVIFKPREYILFKLSTTSGSSNCSLNDKYPLQTFKLYPTNSLSLTDDITILYKSPYLETMAYISNTAASLPLMIIVTNTDGFSKSIYISNYGIVKISR